MKLEDASVEVAAMMCEKLTDPMHGYTVYYDLNDLELKKGG